jgi:hypothetical protein
MGATIKKLRRIAANARATLHRRRIDAKKQHKRLLTVAQAAAMYHVCQNTVYKWCAAGLKKKRQAGLVFLNPKSIQSYLLFGRKRRLTSALDGRGNKAAGGREA